MTALLTKAQHTDALAANLMSGRLWAAKHRPGSNLRGLLTGLARTYQVMDGFLQEFIQEVIPPTTTAYLDEWEEALGIPDDCFPGGGTVAERQAVINIKLVVLAGVSTEAQFESLALDHFGLEITARSGISHVTLAQGGYQTDTPFIDISDFNSDTEEARLTLVISESYPEAITFPWEFPLLFATDGQNSLRCLIEKLAPANVDVLFQEVV